MAEVAGHPLNLAAVVSNHRGSVADVQKQPDGDLKNVVSYHGDETLPFGDVVPLQLVFGWMDAVFGEELIDI